MWSGHQSVTPFLSGAPPLKKILDSSLRWLNTHVKKQEAKKTNSFRFCWKTTLITPKLSIVGSKFSRSACVRILVLRSNAMHERRYKNTDKKENGGQNLNSLPYSARVIIVNRLKFGDSPSGLWWHKTISSVSAFLSKSIFVSFSERPSCALSDGNLILLFNLSVKSGSFFRIHYKN